jgi:hypothetical protein
MPERKHLLRPEKERDLKRHLDMEPPANNERPDRDPHALTSILDRMRIDMSEADREGDEMSGDDHSSGLQGERLSDTHIDDGLPGEETDDDSAFEDDLQKRRLDR